MPAEDYQVVLVTHPSFEQGAEMAGKLVEERLVACVNVIPKIFSIYRWEGEIQRDEEVLLVMKTRSERRAALQARVEELHPYTVPEILSLPVAEGNSAYLEWLTAQT